MSKLSAESQSETVLIDVLESQTVEDIEELLDELHRARELTPVVDLRLPLRLKSARMGGAGAVMQLVAHWSRTCKEFGTLRTYYPSDVTDEKLVEDLEKYEHLLLAVCVAPRIFTRGRDKDITAAARAAARSVLTRRAKHGPRRQMRSLLELVADGWPDLAPRSLYKGGDSRYPLGLKDEYFPLADRILALSQLESSSIDDVKTISALSWALLELFQNTDQWAKSLPGLESDIAALPSCRLIYARWISFSSHDASEHVGTSPALLSYLERSLPEGDSDRVHRFFEITILDMGPGITAWRAAEREQGSSSLDVEVKDLRWSLARRRTTSLDPTKGMGFHRAFLNLTRLDGFIQIRTGKISAFRDFTIDAYPNDRELSDAALPSEARSNYTTIWNWVERGGPREAQVSEQIGTRVTMLIPDRPRRGDS